MDEWVDVKDRQPAEIGWYKVKIKNENTGRIREAEDFYHFNTRSVNSNLKSIVASPIAANDYIWGAELWSHPLDRNIVTHWIDEPLHED